MNPGELTTRNDEPHGHHCPVPCAHYPEDDNLIDDYHTEDTIDNNEE